MVNTSGPGYRGLQSWLDCQYIASYHTSPPCEFIFKNFFSCVKPFVQVHQTVLPVREGKDGWIDLFCPGGICCTDDGEFFSKMVSHPPEV